MVAVSDSSAPLVVVAGATGKQGGSVVQALIESDKQYRIRGLTRDATKPAALKLKEKGVDPFSVTLSLGHEAEVEKAFAGADYVFAVTDFWAHMSLEREVSEGKMMVDAAKKAGATFLWSGLESYKEITNGKYPHVYHFDGKAEITKYAKANVPTIVIQPGFYAINVTTPSFGPRKSEYGGYAFGTVYKEDTVLPIIDIEADYGLFVRAAIEHYKAGDELLAVSEEITVGDLVKQLAEETGKQIAYYGMSDDQLVQAMKGSGSPDAIVDEITEMLFVQRDYGYYGGKDAKPSRKHLARPTRTWRDFVRSADWSQVLN